MVRSKRLIQVFFSVRTPTMRAIYQGRWENYQQTAIDTQSNVSIAKVFLDKIALVAADFMNDKVLPFFDAQNMALFRVLTDRGTEYCGRIETHPYELFLHLSGIEHLQTNGSI